MRPTYIQFLELIDQVVATRGVAYTCGTLSSMLAAEVTDTESIPDNRVTIILNRLQELAEGKYRHVEFVSSGDIFRMAEEHFNLSRGMMSQEFSIQCSNVTYGDASFTIITRQMFFSLLEEALFVLTNDTHTEKNVLEWVYYIESWFRGRCDYIDLEN